MLKQLEATAMRIVARKQGRGCVQRKAMAKERGCRLQFLGQTPMPYPVFAP
jgi:hypothetical protein